MPSDTRTLHWYESRDDNKAIKANGWAFQIAKLVATSPNAKPTYNVVWQSKGTAPSTMLSWKVQYALGWTAEPPSDGVSVRITGEWQECNLGDSFDIDEDGYWTPSSTSGKQGWLNVGNVNYSFPGVQGIHIVVGVWNLKTSEYDPIFVDTTVLPLGSSGIYQPHEMVSWWLQGGDLTGQVFSSTKSTATSLDFSKASDPGTDTYEYSTSYLMTSSKPQWVVSKGPPPAYLTSPPPSARLAALTLGGSPPMFIEFNPLRWTIFFRRFMPINRLKTYSEALRKKLNYEVKDAKVVFENKDTKSTITVEFKKNPPATRLGGGDPAKELLDGDLELLQAEGIIEQDESWEIKAGGPDDANFGGYSVENGAQALAPPPTRAAIEEPQQAPVPTKNGYLGGQQAYQQQGMVGKGMYAQNYQTGVVA